MLPNAEFASLDVLPVNTGHGFQLTPSADEEAESMLRSQPADFLQVHWHTPSENTIDGKSFAMEGHYVHQLESEFADERAGTDHLAVLGVMYELGECNPLLDVFWARFPPEKGEAAAPRGESKTSEVDLLAEVQPLLAGGFYHWTGSLTTPPCSEGVAWYVLKQYTTVCQRQVDRLKTALGKTQNGVDVNNRAVQPVHQRIITQSAGTRSIQLMMNDTPSQAVSLSIGDVEETDGEETDGEDESAKPLIVFLLIEVTIILFMVTCMLVIGYTCLKRFGGSLTMAKTTRLVSDDAEAAVSTTEMSQ